MSTTKEKILCMLDSVRERVMSDDAMMSESVQQQLLEDLSSYSESRPFLSGQQHTSLVLRYLVVGWYFCSLLDRRQQHNDSNESPHHPHHHNST